MFEARHATAFGGSSGGWSGARPLDADPAMLPTRIYTRAADPAAFVPWALRLAPAPVPDQAPDAHAHAHAHAHADPEPVDLSHAVTFETVIDGDARAAAAYAAGMEEGYALALMELAEEKAALCRLMNGLEALTPEPPQALALLLAETVGRLVRQVVGEVAVDPALLAARTQAVAAMVIDEVTPCRVKLHPDDAARLADAVPDQPLTVEIAADPTLAPGTVRLDCGEGWIEDGPDGALERLHLALDRMGAPR